MQEVTTVTFDIKAEVDRLTGGLKAIESQLSEAESAVEMLRERAQHQRGALMFVQLKAREMAEAQKMPQSAPVTEVVAEPT